MTIDRKIVPSIREISSFNIVEASQTKLPNGIPLYTLQGPASEIVKIEWVFPAGNWYQESPLVAFAVNNMLNEGSQKYTSAQIAEFVEFYGGQLGYNVDKDNAYVSLVCPIKYLADIMEVVDDVIKNPVFSEHELLLFCNKHKQQFLVDQSKVKSIARFVHSNMMFGDNHPYGYMVVENDFDNLTQASLFKFYKDRYQSKHCKIIISGDANESVLSLIERHFGADRWNNAGSRIVPDFEIVSSNGTSKYIERPDAVQSAVRIGKPMINKTHPDYIGLSVLNCVLGGYFGSRLMKKIREEKGYTYGINSLLVEFKNAAYFAIVSELGADVTAPAVDDIYNEIRILREQVLPDEELARVKNYMLGDIVRMFDGPFAQADSLISLLEYDLDYSYYYNMVESIKRIDSKSLITLANKYFGAESFYQVIVGKK